MKEEADKLGYAMWDDKDFTIPKEFHLDDNSTMQDALKVFYGAGGYDFFRVENPDKYAARWLDFIGDLYSDIVDGKYESDGKPYSIPLSENEKEVLREQEVPEIFTEDL